MQELRRIRSDSCDLLAALLPRQPASARVAPATRDNAGSDPRGRRRKRLPSAK